MKARAIVRTCVLSVRHNECSHRIRCLFRIAAHILSLSLSLSLSELLPMIVTSDSSTLHRSAEILTSTRPLADIGSDIQINGTSSKLSFIQIASFQSVFVQNGLRPNGLQKQQSRINSRLSNLKLSS